MIGEEQTRGQRQREIVEARRRHIGTVLEQLAREEPAHRLLVDQLAGAVGYFGADEVELLDSIITSLALACATDPLLAISAAVSRLLRGRASYGELVIAADPRDWSMERDEELCDAVVYSAIASMSRRRDRGDASSGVAEIGGAALAALVRVGAAVEHGTLAALVKRVRDADAPRPTEVPTPWCFGSAMFFRPLSVRIEHDQIVAFACHHCGREWPLSSTDLRVTSAGQYVIPTHEGNR